MLSKTSTDYGLINKIKLGCQILCTSIGNHQLLMFTNPHSLWNMQFGYKIKLKPKRFTIRVKDKDVSIAPGMAVTTEIKTGERRVIEFFISPFIKYVDEWLTLRWSPAMRFSVNWHRG